MSTVEFSLVSHMIFEGTRTAPLHARRPFGTRKVRSELAGVVELFLSEASGILRYVSASRWSPPHDLRLSISETRDYLRLRFSYSQPR